MLLVKPNPNLSLKSLSFKAIVYLLITGFVLILAFLVFWQQGNPPTMPEMMSAHASHHSLPFMAVGIIPMGMIAIGVVPMGIIAIGIVPMGLISFGLVAMGAIATGLQAMGLIRIGRH